MTNNNYEKNIELHRYEIDTLKETVSKTTQALDNLIKALNDQNTQFAVFNTKHNGVNAQLQSIKKDVKAHEAELARMIPFVEGLRGMFWKLMIGVVTGGTLVGTIITLVKDSTNTAT